MAALHINRTRTTRIFGALALLASLAASTAVRASEQSELLYSRGLVDFHAARYKEALQLFDQAVQADPKDAYARYYRGVTEGRLGDFPAAAVDLRSVLSAKPDLDQGALELGVALVQTAAYKDALPWLEQAQRIKNLDAEASFFLGLAQLRLGQLDAARQNFARAAAGDPELDLSARYYQGVIEYQAQNWSKAAPHFERVVATSPTSQMGKEAAAFLARIRQGVKAPERRYTLHAALGVEYDSNVQLAPQDESLKQQQGISKQEDGRGTILVGGAFSPWRTDHALFSVGYEFFQSLHFDLTEFNLQDHRPSAQLAFDWDPIRFGIMGRYDYYLQETDSFLQQGTGVPWVSIAEGDFGRTELFLRVRRRDFLERPFSGVLDSFNYAPGMRQYVHLGAPQRYVFAGYRFDREDPINQAGNPFAYDGNEFSAGGGSNLPLEITAQIEYAFRHERYAQQSNGRRDDEHLLVFAADKQLGDHLSLTLAYLGDFNNSNQQLFNYERSIVSLSLGVRF
jgi:Flp pilus assembly protein TadD